MASLASRGSAILILGMHRSGTSSLTRILNLHGANLGTWLLEAAADNEAGFWENYYAVDLNEKVLAALGFAWDDPRLLPDGWCSSQVVAPMRRQLKELIKREFEPSPLWAVKDPRLCRLVPLWQAAVIECNYVPKHLITVRHPEEVVQSLIKRNGMSPASASLLWLRHLSESIVEGDASDRALVTYDQLLTDWRSCMARISEGFHIEWPVTSAACAEAVDAHLNPDLRHNITGQKPAVLPVPWRSLLLDVYEAYRVAASGSGSISDLVGLLKEAESRFAFVEPLASDVVPNSQFETLLQAMEGKDGYVPHPESVDARSVVSDVVQKLDAARVTAFERAEKLQQASETLAQQEFAMYAAKESLQTLMDRYDRTVVELSGTQAEKVAIEAERCARVQELAALKESLQALMGRYDRTVAELNGAQAEKAAIEAERRAMVQDLAELKMERDSERSFVEELRTNVQEKEAVVAQLRKDLAASVSDSEFRGVVVQRDTLQRKLLLAEESLQGLAERNHLVTAELGQIKASLSWGLTGPLRRVMRRHAWLRRFATSGVHWVRRLSRAGGISQSDLAFGHDTSSSSHTGSVVAGGNDQLRALFVEEWYLSTNEDVRLAQLDPFNHFIQFGMAEGRSPTPLIDIDFYLNTNGDVREANINPLIHFLEHGGVEGRSPHPLFDARWYLEKNPDVRECGVNPLLHFVEFGAREGRNPNSLFDVSWYKHEYLRHEDAGVNPLVHYVLHGSTIRLQPCLLFNAKRYASDHDLPPGDDALEHHLLLARSHGHDPLEVLRLRLQWSQREALGITLPKTAPKGVVVGFVTYNNDHRELQRSVRSADQALLDYDQSGGAIYIIDNGEASGVVPGLAAKVEHFSTQGNVGFGAAHNVLMAHAFEQGADVYIAANPDGAFEPGCISALLAMSVAAQGRALIEAIQFPEEHPKTYDLWGFDTPWASGACLLITREIYQAIGGFADEFFMYCEDVDISWRARREGFQVKTCPRARFFHPVTDRGFDLEVQRRFLTSGLILARKWRSAAFEQTILGQFGEYGLKVPNVGPVKVMDEPLNVADFSHSFSFASTRW
ncbi:hypothetical protein [Rhodanobacter thiooxydans]|uniref:hypothetical protein n=1 Tax=Rhodanobacter thiooxydans TaxID=416169 RepID=UPI0012DC015A|nr:hypothetical protein [Rhodanobacter thiooxydans]